MGRSYAYAVAADGQRGVSRLIELLSTEMDVAIGHMGIKSVSELFARRDEVLLKR